MNGLRYARIVVAAGLTIAGLAAAAPPAFGQGVDLEPNDSCATAQDVGAVGDRLVLAGGIDPVGAKPDIDFFRLTAAPDDTLFVDLDGADGGAGTLPDPYAGVFDGACNVLAVGDDARGSRNPHIVVRVPSDGTLIVAATHCCDGTFTGSGIPGSYRLTIGRQQTIGSIRGRLLDADTGRPPAVDYATIIDLRACRDGACNPEPVAQVNASDDGSFAFSADRSGGPIDAGAFEIVVATMTPFGERIERARTPQFEVATSANVDVGDIVLPRLPRARSIAGRVVDATSARPLGGDDLPAALVELYRCGVADCGSFVATVLTDADGGFVFDLDAGGRPLPLYPGDFVLHVSADLYEPQASARFAAADGADVAVGDIALRPLPRVASVSGRIVDAVSLQPLPGDDRPFARASLIACGNGSCGVLATRDVGPDGRYRFEADDGGRPLPVGDYWVQAAAEQYAPKDGRHVRGRADQDVDLGDVALTSLPIRFTEARSCGDLPPEGGECAYSVRVANGTGVPFDGAVWSMVNVQATGSILGLSRFQAGDAVPLTLASGAGQIVRFRMDIPTRLRAGAMICAEAFAGRGPTPLFDTIGQRDLFCVTKRPAGFALLTDAEAAAALHGRRSLAPLPLLDALGSPDER